MSPLSRSFPRSAPAIRRQREAPTRTAASCLQCNGPCGKIKHILMRLIWSLLLLACAANAATIAEKTAGTTRLPGYFPLYWDAKAGKMWLEVDKWDSEFLYLESLPAGLGQNDVGLDRGQ